MKEEVNSNFPRCSRQHSNEEIQNFRSCTFPNKKYAEISTFLTTRVPIHLNLRSSVMQFSRKIGQGRNHAHTTKANYGVNWNFVKFLH